MHSGLIYIALRRSLDQNSDQEKIHILKSIAASNIKLGHNILDFLLNKYTKTELKSMTTLSKQKAKFTYK